MTLPTPRFLLALAATALAGPALADAPGRDWMPIDQALQTLTEAGYGNVRSLKADDGAWKAGATRDGRAVKLLVDPRSGAIVETSSKEARQESRQEEKHERAED